MSEDDKKRDRALQRRVRERQAKTGESYQAAWRQLTGSDDAPSSDSDAAPSSEIKSDEAAQILANHSEQLIRINTQLFEGTIRVLGQQNQNLHEQVTTLTKELEDKKRLSAQAQVGLSTSRLVLPLHLPRVLPHQPTRATARAKEGAVDIDQIFISGAGTEGGAGDWIVNDIEIDGRSQLTLKNLSGSLFGTRGVAANPRAEAALSIEGFDPVEYDRELAIIVTYIGPNPDGVHFFASAIGTSPPQRPTIVPIVSDAPLPISTKVTIGARIENAPFQIDRLEIEDAWDWIVNDLRINGRTQFVQSGDIPGDMFATNAITSFVSLEDCKVGGEIEIDVTYIGAAPPPSRSMSALPIQPPSAASAAEAIFKGRLEGTVVRDDYSVPPPDLRVITRTGDKITDAPAIGTCNWRPPLIRARAS
jgi:hypothetical protein